MDDAELSFPYDRITRFKDLEGAGRVVTNPKSLRAGYLTRLACFLGRHRSSCFERAGSAIAWSTPNSLTTCSPAAYLEKRARWDRMNLEEWKRD